MRATSHVGTFFFKKKKNNIPESEADNFDMQGIGSICSVINSCNEHSEIKRRGIQKTGRSQGTDVHARFE